jgi:hypothetical protein
MSFLYTLLTSFLLTFSVNSDIPYDKLELAFRNQDARYITSLGQDKMMVNVLGKGSAYSQSQAALVLKDFFAQKNQGEFKFTFKGKETNDGSFAIGEYRSKDELFRVTIKFKKIANEFKIESLIIEKA